MKDDDPEIAINRESDQPGYRSTGKVYGCSWLIRKYYGRCHSATVQGVSRSLHSVVPYFFTAYLKATVFFVFR